MNKKLNKEPYILIDHKKLAKWSKKDEITHAQQCRQFEKANFFQKAFDKIYDTAIEGDYFEFGCHRARTFSFALMEARKRNMKINFHAFDSFEGLPFYKDMEKQNHLMKHGALTTSKEEFLKIVNRFKYYKKNIKVVKGYYEDSLNPSLLKKYKKNKIKVALINLDCDLVQPVEKALKFCLNFAVDGTILYVDDYYLTFKGNPRKGIPAKINQIISNSKFFLEPYLNVGCTAKSFMMFKK